MESDDNTPLTFRLPGLGVRKASADGPPVTATPKKKQKMFDSYPDHSTEEPTEKIRGELDSVKKEINLLSQKKSEAIKCLQDAQTLITILRRDKENALKRANQAGHAKVKLQDEVTNLKADLDKLKTDLIVKGVEVVTAVESFKNSKEFADIKQEWDDLLRNELNEAHKEMCNLRKEKQDAINKVRKLEDEVVKLNKERREVEDKMVELRKEKQNAVNRTIQLKLEVAKLHKEKQNVNDKSSQVEQQMVKFKADIKKLLQL
ncbi:unnamed protein product [Cuscuta epithymum]|uniref:Uncharacterized protein n=1 Tax=Cuscuta epithymum TaxID=186058 RepID=A0AAV0CMF9_9ASTE|nr:unnamed protein product [Cuscuta epithymum]